MGSIVHLSYLKKLLKGLDCFTGAMKWWFINSAKIRHNKKDVVGISQWNRFQDRDCSIARIAAQFWQRKVRGNLKFFTFSMDAFEHDFKPIGDPNSIQNISFLRGSMSAFVTSS
jgi:hypothetical protein